MTVVSKDSVIIQKRQSVFLAEEEYSDKNKPTLELHINNNFVEMAELLAHQLSSAGFKVEIKLHPADMMMQLAATGQLEFFDVHGWQTIPMRKTS